jgi:hypothetical protein
VADENMSNDDGRVMGHTGHVALINHIYETGDSGIRYLFIAGDVILLMCDEEVSQLGWMDGVRLLRTFLHTKATNLEPNRRHHQRQQIRTRDDAASDCVLQKKEIISHVELPRYK